MENNLNKEINEIKTQEEYETALGNRDFMRSTIMFAEGEILRLSKKIAEEWEYIHDYKAILEHCDEAILRWEIEHGVKEK